MRLSAKHSKSACMSCPLITLVIVITWVMTSLVSQMLAGHYTSQHSVGASMKKTAHGITIAIDYRWSSHKGHEPPSVIYAITEQC